MMADFKLTGMDDVLRLLRELPAEVSAKRGGPVKRALGKGARVIATEVGLNLARSIGGLDTDEDHSTGLLLSALVVTRGKAPIEGKGERYLVRFKRKTYARNGKPVTTLASAQIKEYGSEKQQAEPFIRPAVTSKGREAIDVATKSLAADLEKLAAKYLKK